MLVWRAVKGTAMTETRKLLRRMWPDTVGLLRPIRSGHLRLGGGVHSRLECMLSGGSWVSLVIARHRQGCNMTGIRLCSFFG